MHLEQVTHAVKAPRPFDWYDLTQSVASATADIAKYGIHNPTWEIIEPDCEWWYRHRRMMVEKATRPETREVALLATGWAEKE